MVKNLSQNWVFTGGLCKICISIKTHHNLRIGCSMCFIEVKVLSS